MRFAQSYADHLSLMESEMNLDETKHLLSAQAVGFLSGMHHRMLIDGVWVDAASAERIHVIDPATEESIATVPAASAIDVDAAVRAARRAFDTGPWPTMKPVERQRLMLKLADLIEARAQTFAEIESLNNGKSVSVAMAVDVGQAIDFMRYMAGWVTKIEGVTCDVSVPYAPGARFVSHTRREAVGVVAAIVPWNFPLMIAVWKLGAALAAGCTVVLKPAEQTPLTALMLGQAIMDAGFPGGVVNIVTGEGRSAGGPLASHPLIDKVSFTGSTEVGRLIGHAAMDNMTRATLELGGKSPVIVLDDCDPSVAAAGATQAIFFNHGQACSAGSRLYVPRKMFDRVLADVVSMANQLPMGHGLDPNTQMGPLISHGQLQRVCGYIESGLQQGASLLTGGERVSRKGFYLQPTVMINVNQGMRVVQEEIFGPVLTALPYDTIDEAVRLANDTPFGLGASIWSNDLSRVQQLIPKIKAGTVWVNCHNVVDPAMPFGGYKQSGVGRDLGKASLDAYLETKSVIMAS